LGFFFGTGPRNVYDFPAAAAQSPITVEPFSFSFFMVVTVSVGNNKTAMGGKISICRPRHFGRLDSLLLQISVNQAVIIRIRLVTP